MKKIISLLFFTLVFGVNAFAHQAFTLVSSVKKTIKLAELIELEKVRTLGKKENQNLTFTENEIYLIVKTGPEDDMLSYRIQGVRNPNLVVSDGATLKILFVNSDEDMPHDIHFGHVIADFGIAPSIAEAVGTNKLEHKAEDETMQAEEIVIKPTEEGAYKYFCSVKGHAKGGMWGNIFVGVKPGDKVKVAEKNASPDENMEMPGMKMDDKKSDSMPEMKMPDKKPDEMSDMKMSDKKTDSMSDMNMPGMSHDAMKMSAVTDINSPMSRESSGTAWMPESSPMYMNMKMFKDGSMLMLHGNLFFRYTDINTKRDLSVGGRGDNARFDAPSMFMAMYSKPLSNKSQLGLRVMLSLDPIIERGFGYPLLYQSGEVYRNVPIHDRQHPHDFFSELSASYSYKVNDKQSFYFYAGYPGEPALGPPTFMHRLSAMNNPDAPIGHHWQDSTHITWGVLTAGYNFGKFKFETSVFKGTEPDANRWNFDAPKLNSFSARVSWNPNKNWSFQISHGYLKNPETSEPELKIQRRTTASAIYNKKFNENKNWANSFVWGQNYGNGERTNAYLFESNYDFYKNAVFGRLERVQKSGHELALDAVDENKIFNVGAYSIGYLREIYQSKNLTMGLGAQTTFYQNPSSLSSYYGGTNHQGWQIFLRLRSSLMK
jgi:plastocyanin